MYDKVQQTLENLSSANLKADGSRLSRVAEREKQRGRLQKENILIFQQQKNFLASSQMLGNLHRLMRNMS